MALTYCDIAPGHEWHGPYHDDEYGFPLVGDAELFERLVLEINQAGPTAALRSNSGQRAMSISAGFVRRSCRARVDYDTRLSTPTR